MLLGLLRALASQMVGHVIVFRGHRHLHTLLLDGLKLAVGRAARHEQLAELAVGGDVDDKVDGGVGDGQHVAHRRVVVVPVAAVAGRLVDGRPQDVVDKGGRLATHKDEDHHDQNQRHVLLVVPFAHLRALLLALL